MKTLLLALLLFGAPLQTVHAQAMLDPGQAPTTEGTQPTTCPEGGLQLGVPLGDLKSVPKGADAFRCYVLGFYKYIIGLAVILASIVSTYAGYIWLTSGGDPARITHARELIIGALSGLALLLLASVVLRLIGIGSS